MELASLITKFNSNFAEKSLALCDDWLKSVDSLIAHNLNTLTCDDLQQMYFVFFENLKRWRSCSHGFTGFSEFLVFRALYNTIESRGEHFEPFNGRNTMTDPIIFKSQNYEIGQNVTTTRAGITLEKGYKIPDIYIKKAGKPISIIQIKVVLTGEQNQISNETRTFELLKEHNKDLKGLFITFIPDGFTIIKRKMLEEVGFKTIILKDNLEIITQVLNEVI